MEARVNVADHSLRIAVLKAILDRIGAEYTDARKAAEEAFRNNGIKALSVSLPDGLEVGSISVKKASTTVDVDMEKLLDWVAEHTPTEIEEHLDEAALTDQELIEYARTHRDDLLRRRIRGAWESELMHQIRSHDGHVVDPTTGESTKVADITTGRPSGAFAYNPDRTAAAVILAAISRRELQVPGLTVLPLELSEAS